VGKSIQEEPCGEDVSKGSRENHATARQSLGRRRGTCPWDREDERGKEILIDAF